MPQNLLRDEENSTRKKRLANTKRGPGVFVYDGSHEDHECTPTHLCRGQGEPRLDENGYPVIDSDGGQVFERVGSVVKDAFGRPVLGGLPKITRIPIEERVIWGVRFPQGERVAVRNAALALKLRCLNGFEEVDAEPADLAPPKVDEPKRGRKKKADNAVT